MAKASSYSGLGKSCQHRSRVPSIPGYGAPHEPFVVVHGARLLPGVAACIAKPAGSNDVSALITATVLSSQEMLGGTSEA